jgi:hypothetical protein
MRRVVFDKGLELVDRLPGELLIQGGRRGLVVVAEAELVLRLRSAGARRVVPSHHPVFERRHEVLLPHKAGFREIELRVGRDRAAAVLERQHRELVHGVQVVPVIKQRFRLGVSLLGR